MRRPRLWQMCLIACAPCFSLATERAAAQQTYSWPEIACTSPPDWSLPTRSSMHPKPAPRGPKLAQPTAAPPSAEIVSLPAPKKLEPRPEAKPQVSEAPKADVRPKQPAAAVREEGPFYDSFPIALKGNQKPTDDRCTVTFTNLSDRGIKLRIGDQERALPAGESATLPVTRQFVWHMEGREAQNEKIGAGDYAVQIVIRR